VVVLVLVASEDGKDSHADHVGERVFDEVGIARVVERGGELLGQTDALVELAQRQQAGVGGEWSVGDPNLDGQGREKVELE
jgi:hypothetical protein